MKIALTIDFDFFVREDPLWDWQHSEAMGDFLWPSRASGLILNKIPLESLLQGDPDTFFARLRARGVSFKKCELLAVCDSHAAGSSFYKTVVQNFGSKRSMPLLNFDAHHDLGYHPRGQLMDMRRRGAVEAGSWAWQLVTQRPTLSYEIVYPTWRGKRELHTCPTIPLTPSERAQCRFSTETEWFDRPGKPLEVAGLLLVRSGAWTPPWLDGAWTRFLEAAAIVTGENPLALWERRGPSVFDPRPWDPADAQTLANLTQQLRGLNAQSGVEVSAP